MAYWLEGSATSLDSLSTLCCPGRVRGLHRDHQHCYRSWPGPAVCGTLWNVQVDLGQSFIYVLHFYYTIIPLYCTMAIQGKIHIYLMLMFCWYHSVVQTDPGRVQPRDSRLPGQVGWSCAGEIFSCFQIFSTSEIFSLARSRISTHFSRRLSHPRNSPWNSTTGNAEDLFSVEIRQKYIIRMNAIYF